MTRRRGRTLFVFAVGLLVAMFAYRWITDPQPRAARAEEERVVMTSRQVLRAAIELEALEIVDPLAPRRKVGKSYIYPEQGGWAVSGYYRRDEADSWHPYLMALNEELDLLSLKLDDQALHYLAVDNPKLSILP